MKKLFLIELIFLSQFVFAQTRSVLLMNGTLHVGNGEVINNSLVAFQNGKITLVANALVTTIDKSKFDTVINVAEKHIYPGFIGCNSALGLKEIDAARPTIDVSEVGALNPDVRSQIAYNTDSRIIPTVRSNGILMIQCAPRGGTLSGMSSIMKTSGWNWEDATIKADEGQHLHWPAFAPVRRRRMPAEKPESEENVYAKQCDAIKLFFEEAKAYNAKGTYAKIDIRFESMRKLFEDKQTLYIHANLVKEITDAVVFARDLGIKKLCIVGGYEAASVAPLLKENKVSVMLRRVHDLPFRDDEEVDRTFKLPALLQAAGVLYCIQNEGDQDAVNLRNLPFQAGTAVAYGITKEQALSAITFNAAKILGIDKEYGSVEMNKSATLFVSDGDALDIRTNNVTIAWTNGEKIDLNNHHKEQFEKYKKKYSKR